MKYADRILAGVTFLSLLFWVAVIFLTPDPFYGAVYYIPVIGLLGSLLYYRWSRVATLLQSWRLPPGIKFFIVGYTVVLLEEVVAAFGNHWSEGFYLPLYLVRIGQFWAFNILAFTGFIAGWYFLSRRYQYSYREMFYLAGLWGLYAEGMYRWLTSNPLGVVFLVGPIIVTYGLMVLPMVLTVPVRERTTLARIKKYPLTFLVLFIFSAIPVLILTILRSHFPELFPPTTMIQ
jgi:hypothetical protein